MMRIYKHIVIQSEAKDLGNTMAGVNVDVHEIFRTESSTTRLPPFGRLNDRKKDN